MAPLTPKVLTIPCAPMLKPTLRFL